MESKIENISTIGINKSKNTIKGVLISIITTLILLCIFSAILAYTDVPESTITPVIMIITAISILIGSTIGNHKIQKNGILNGGIVGATYMIILYLISSILSGNYALNITSIILIIVGIVFGILGGIIAVNQK